MSTSDVARSGGKLDRRQFLARGARLAAGGVLAGGAPSLLAACGGSSHSASTAASTTVGSTSATPATSSTKSLTPVTVQLTWYKNVRFAGSYFAVQNAYYKDHGLAVKLVAGGPNIAAEPVVSEGKALIGFSEVDTIAAARAKGAPLKIFAVKFQKSPYCIVSLAKSPIMTPQDMVGKKIGAAATSITALQTLCKLNNIDYSKLHIVPVQDDPAPLPAGEVDGIVDWVTNEVVTLQVRGVDVHTFLFSDYKYAIFNDAYLATEDTIANHADVLASFVAAERQGWQQDITSPNAGVQLAVSDYGKSLGLDTKQQQLENTAQLTLMLTDYTKAHGLFSMDPVTLQQSIETLSVAGIHTSVDDLFTTSILDKLS